MLDQVEIGQWDIFVGILGHLYGSSPKESDISYSELEYTLAVSAQKPTLMFLASEDFPVPANLLEEDERLSKQQAFRQRVANRQQVEFFKSHTHLSSVTVQAIHNCEVARRSGPQRSEGKSENCTTLLFPFTTNTFGMDTGISICNASAKPVGMCPTAGPCTIHFFGAVFGSGEKAFARTQTSSVVEPGETLAFTIWLGNPLWLIEAVPGFQGYLVAECRFPDAHGFAFLNDGEEGTPTLAAGYLAHVVSKDRH